MQSKLTWLFIRFPEIDLKALGFPQGWETEVTTQFAPTENFSLINYKLDFAYFHHHHEHPLQAALLRSLQ